MGIKFKHILNENSDKVNRYIDFLLPKLKEYYENKYNDHDWVEAAMIFSEKSRIEQIKEGLYNSKSLTEEIESLFKRLNRVEMLSPKEIRDISEKINEKNRELNKVITTITQPYNWFPEFINQYSLDMNIIIPLIDRFHAELYKPARIEMLKNREGLGVEYSEDVPEGANYLDTIDSGRGKGFYSIYEHDGRYLLRVKLDWTSDGGIYYLYADNKDEIMNIINHYEFSDVLNSMKGSINSGNDMNMVEELIKILNRVTVPELEYLKKREIDADSIIWVVLDEAGENPQEFRFTRYEDDEIFMSVYLKYRHLLLDIENRIKSL